MEALENHEYYYKTVEEAHAISISIMKAIAEVSGSSVENLDLPDKIIWTNFLSESENKSFSDEELTDEMKEAIAIANKECLDPIIQFAKQFDRPKFFRLREIVIRSKAIMQELQNEIDKYYSTLIEFSSCKDTDIHPLILSDDELYSILLMLEPDELRNVLPSSISVSTYSTVLKSIKCHDRILFNSQLSELHISDFGDLKGYLIPKIEEILPYESYFASLLDGESSLEEYLIGEEAGNNETFLDDYEHIMTCAASKTIFEPKIYERYVQHLINFIFRVLFSAQDLPLILKRKAKEIVKKWNEGLAYNEAIDIDSIDSPSQLRALEIYSKIRHKWILKGLSQLICQKQHDILLEATEITGKESMRLPYPSRIESKIKGPREQNEILSGLYKEYGRFFESKDGSLISHDDFLYLFSGRIARPLTYHPPYYWNQDFKNFAGLIRLLYTGQAKGFDDLIHLVNDKDKNLEKSSIKWSSKKQGLGKTTLKPIEDKIQNIVFEVAGIHLSSVDLTKQNVNTNKDDKVD